MLRERARAQRQKAVSCDDIKKDVQSESANLKKHQTEVVKDPPQLLNMFNQQFKKTERAENNDSIVEIEEKVEASELETDPEDEADKVLELSIDQINITPDLTRKGLTASI